MGAAQVPALADVEQGRGGPAVCACLWAVAERATALGLQVPRFGGADGLRGGMPRSAAAKRVRWSIRSQSCCCQQGHFKWHQLLQALVAPQALLSDIPPRCALQAELFEGSGDSPPKLPALNKL